MYVNNISERSSSRVLQQPGGASSFNIFGGSDEPVAPPSGRRGAPAAAEPAPQSFGKGRFAQQAREYNPTVPQGFQDEAVAPSRGRGRVQQQEREINPTLPYEAQRDLKDSEARAPRVREPEQPVAAAVEEEATNNHRRGQRQARENNPTVPQDAAQHSTFTSSGGGRGRFATQAREHNPTVPDAFQQPAPRVVQQQEKPASQSSSIGAVFQEEQAPRPTVATSSGFHSRTASNTPFARDDQAQRSSPPTPSKGVANSPFARDDQPVASSASSSKRSTQTADAPFARDDQVKSNSRPGSSQQTARSQNNIWGSDEKEATARPSTRVLQQAGGSSSGVFGALGGDVPAPQARTTNTGRANLTSANSPFSQEPLPVRSSTRIHHAPGGGGNGNILSWGQ